MKSPKNGRLLLLLLLFGVRSSKTHHSQIRTSCIANAKLPTSHLHTPHLTAPMSKDFEKVGSYLSHHIQ